MNRNLTRNFNRDKQIAMNNLFKSTSEVDVENEVINDPLKMQSLAKEMTQMYNMKARERVTEGVAGAIQRELFKNNKIISLNSSLSGENQSY